jgi:NAD(P)-dependent dehydrogenase (short-subunit alcohol dehydrogenase family)
MELQDKTIIITGASSGIGKAAALLFAAEGAKVVLGARRADPLAAVADQINQAGGHAAHLCGDVRDESYAEALVALAVETFGGLDGAFNNAGTVGDMGPVTEMTLAAWNDVIATNLTSAFLAAKAQLPALLARGKGSIVFNSSFVVSATAACRAWRPMRRRRPG